MSLPTSGQSIRPVPLNGWQSREADEKSITGSPPSPVDIWNKKAMGMISILESAHPGVRPGKNIVAAQRYLPAQYVERFFCSMPPLDWPCRVISNRCSERSARKSLPQYTATLLDPCVENRASAMLANVAMDAAKTKCTSMAGRSNKTTHEHSADNQSTNVQPKEC